MVLGEKFDLGRIDGEGVLRVRGTVARPELTGRLTAIAKGAYFFADSGSGYPDIKQFTLGANVKF